MRKLLLFLFAINIILLSFATFQNIVYQNLIPRLMWAVDTLKINSDINRQKFLDCEFDIHKRMP